MLMPCFIVAFTVLFKLVLLNPCFMDLSPTEKKKITYFFFQQNLESEPCNDPIFFKSYKFICEFEDRPMSLITYVGDIELILDSSSRLEYG